jgi:pre-mRNA-splicing factor ATP-dependent RNA helicase DHX38/PRP16
MLAAKSFGKFQDSFLTELHAEILSHAKQEAADLAPQPIQGIIVHETDILVPEAVHPGGLFQRSDSVSNMFPIETPLCIYSVIQRHTFRKPAKPLDPPTPRASILGLDRLAKEKREAAVTERADDGNTRKKPRLEDGVERPHFKGQSRSRQALVSITNT